MNIEEAIKSSVCQAIQALYDKEISQKQVQIKNIPKEQDGDYSVITFPFAKLLGKAPQQIAEELGKYLAEENAMISKYNAVKGFCNLSIGDGYWLSFLSEVLQDANYGQHPKNGETVVVEYSSPNTNKPLHLGHIRNNLLGYASAEILKAAGYAVKKVQIINDRGVHICKSMLAWQKFGNGETPESSGMKGDHLVGKYYVRFEKAFQAEYKAWQTTREAKLKAEKWLFSPVNLKKAKSKIGKDLTKLNNKLRNEAIDTFKAILWASLSSFLSKKMIKEVKKDNKSVQIPIKYKGRLSEFIKSDVFINILSLYIYSTKKARLDKFLFRKIKENYYSRNAPIDKRIHKGMTLSISDLISDLIEISEASQRLRWKNFELKDTIFISQYLSSCVTAIPSLKGFKNWLATRKDRFGFGVGDYPLNSYYNYFFKEVYKNKYFNEKSLIGHEAKTMLQDWEAGKKEVIDLWLTMNGWVYEGFESTYKRLGVDFDKLYYESETYLEGKDMVEMELAKEKSIFFKKEDGSTWIDLKDAKLDEKVVLRKDGTSMYITQDIGTANLRFQDYKMDKMVYVVGNEQDYHFKVLFEILARLGHPYAKNCHHLSYGMVNLTTGRMKSREGTVVDADDLMQSIYEEVKAESESRATLDNLSDEAKHEIWDKVALGALKFYILKVESKKSMIFNPQQSIELQGQTGPYVQNAYVRTQAVQRKFATKDFKLVSYENYQLHDVERDILIYVHDYPNVIQTAAKNYNPADIANYIYNLAKAYHKFWNDVTILDENDLAGASFRLDMSKAVAVTLLNAAALIGIHMPDRM